MREVGPLVSAFDRARQGSLYMHIHCSRQIETSTLRTSREGERRGGGNKYERCPIGVIPCEDDGESCRCPKRRKDSGYMVEESKGNAGRFEGKGLK